MLKPGGIIGCRELICRSSFTYPEYGVLHHAWRMLEDVLSTDDGHPNIGRQLKEQLLASGFSAVRASGSFDVYDAPSEVEFVHRFATRWFLSPAMAEAAIQYGVATAEQLAQIRTAYEIWKDDPAAFCALAFGEAIASKPH